MLTEVVSEPVRKRIRLGNQADDSLRHHFTGVFLSGDGENLGDMPVVTINGEKKKVACGPCIRGHRSSKCAHKDRVLIEVRKPGRPLGTCPHPGGSCGCERIVVNYCLPKSVGSSSSSTPSEVPFLNPAKVQKTKPQRQISNFPHATVKDIIQGNAKGLATLANIPPREFVQSETASLGTSSAPPSAPSSTNSTPMATTDSIIATQGQAPEQPGLFARWADYYPTPTASGSVTSRSESSFSQDQAAPKSCCSTNTPSTEPFTAPAATVPASPALLPNSFGLNLPPNLLYNLSELDTNFQSYEFTPGCPMPPVSQNGIQVERACECGDSCECFACTTHPHNRTTMDYVRFHTELALGPQSSGSFQHPVYSGFAQPGQAPMAMPPMSQPFVPGGASQTFTNQTAYDLSSMTWIHPTLPPQIPPNLRSQQNGRLPFQPQPGIVHSQQARPNPFTSPAAGHSFTPLPLLDPAPRSQTQHGSANAKKEQSILPQNPSVASHTPADADSLTDEDSSTLSPSSFYLQQFTLDCDDMTGTCQCEEGCVCPGCTTHSGHIGGHSNSLTL